MHVLNARRESLIASGFIQPVQLIRDSVCELQLIRDSVCELLIDVSPRFERRTTISQSACADDTHHSFDRQFYWTVQNHFLSMDPRCVKGPDLSYTSEREKPSKHVGTVTLLSDFCRSIISPGDGLILARVVAVLSVLVHGDQVHSISRYTRYT